MGEEPDANSAKASVSFGCKEIFTLTNEGEDLIVDDI